MPVAGWQWLAAVSVALVAHAVVGLALLERSRPVAADGSGFLREISIGTAGWSSATAETAPVPRADASSVASRKQSLPPASRSVIAEAALMSESVTRFAAVNQASRSMAADAPVMERSLSPLPNADAARAAKPLAAAASGPPAVPVRTEREPPPAPRTRPDTPRPGPKTAAMPKAPEAATPSDSEREGRALPAHGAGAERAAVGADHRAEPAGPAGAAPDPSAKSAYAALLFAWLKRHQIYPETALARRQQGTAVVFFEIDRQGRLLETRLEQSSGFPLLDREALAMLRRASPMPPTPAAITGQTYSALFPVEFQVR